ncbi:RDD family protein [Vulcaniibacterium tengchongense]|uniref:Putative RDD family membrane protein YckC n=1 Tax=Vulcaniibacterium tengchongense TaxID=1273429 RepID=A0A3N4VIX7_9GAMM|nr:RDD family protein [Vulcaniibacterium tengchongense]RPE81375.1 putative RDD family membrane protein YckC [Vulcaniibacterium tengchongense]
MEQQNPYQSPQTQVQDYSGDLRLAGRGKRLGAALLDAVIAIVVMLPIMFAGGYFATMSDGGPGIGVQLLWGVVGLAVFFAIQYVPLKNSGQTWGKKIVGIRIVDMEGRQPDLGVLLGRRYLFANGIGLVPLVGGLISLVNVLFIFRSDRRCLHDVVADTQVVEAD